MKIKDDETPSKKEFEQEVKSIVMKKLQDLKKKKKEEDG